MSYPAEISVVATRKVPLPGQFYQLEASEPTSLYRIARQPNLKFVLLLPFASEADDDASLFDFGVVSRVLQTTTGRRRAKLTVRALVRARVDTMLQEEPFPRARITPFPDDDASFSDSPEAAAFRKLVEQFLGGIDRPLRVLDVIQSSPIGGLADALATALSATYSEQLALLAATDVAERLKLVAMLVSRASKSSSLSGSGGGKKVVGPNSSKAIVPHKGSSAAAAVDKLKERLLQAEIPEGEARDSIMADFEKLARMSKNSSDYEVTRTYLEFCAQLPWNKSTDDQLSLVKASKQLNDDHYGLETVKRRILEYLAVLKMRKDMQAPLLCFIGPPGCGKSSLGKSIAAALGRKFHRIALGGVRDEAVLRGHRRTYVGALPGRIMDALKKTGVNNPVILLDEIDKMGMDQRGDPAAALLEVLDPVQNSEFTDHYLGVPFDLSKVLFIATGNSENIPAALKDRMELVDVPGYSFEEKVEICKSNLIPKQLKAHGMSEGSIVITDGALMELARSYTRESGVRSLNRQIGAIVRYIVASVVRDDEGSQLAHQGLMKTVTTVGEDRLEEILGPAKYEEDSSRDRLSRFGVSVGLGYTGTGSGSVLYIETAQMPGSGKIRTTGSLGDVMKESVITALSWIRSNMEDAHVSGPVLDDMDVHVHFPAGATPKDGPSAGVAITVALVSLLSKRLVRPDSVMTGEMSLTGVVLPVGGIKEKTLAAHRNGFRRMYLPKLNMKDLHDVPDSVKNDIQFIPVSSIEQVLESVFEEDEGPRVKAKL